MSSHGESWIKCPHCDHRILLSYEISDGSQEFYQDCSACCHPIHINMEIDEQHKTIRLFIDADDEQIF